ncbi:phosphatidylinositol 4-kinase gamma 8-like [Pistacia vera]|uniref:phosphatidylinositol 4-kinase gamma 8-like n=1 Tax=Pistacia vera TaxID=55513 RepID=UPI0012639A91|nr:phosphatidylinositol 4-kinase gamma 8-like [Pistacia vera]
MRLFEMAVAIDPHHGFKPFNRSQKCRLQSFTQFDYNILELNQTNLAHSLKQAFEVANIHRSFSTPCLSLANNVDDEFDTNQRIEIVGGGGAPRVRALVVEVAIALASGVEPIPVSGGLGGAYFLPGRNGDIIAVAKPIDEEPLAFNNPKGFGGFMAGQPGLKRSVRIGETGVRELAAYLLDHDGFVGVPPTALVKISPVGFNVNDSSPISNTPFKIASLQRFVDHEYDAGELGSSSFSVASIHQIGIFDVRVLNLDRHAGNMLVKKHDRHENYGGEAAELVPIDHGLCLPEWLDDPYFEWLHWPQASVPFSESELEYVSNLDPFKDAEMLRAKLPSLRESSIRVLILCTIFLKQAAAAGLCLAEIGEMMTREFCDEENLSVLETVCAKAKEKVMNILEDEKEEEEEEEEENNDENKETEQEFEMFQFEIENEDSSHDVMDLPQPLQNPADMFNATKTKRFLSVRAMPRLQDPALFPLYEENVPDNGDDDDDESDSKSIKEKSGNGESDNNKVGGFAKSMSFLVRSYNCESGGTCFGEMSEGEWEVFLKTFEEGLPQVIEETKCMTLKQRLGTSCKF